MQRFSCAARLRFEAFSPCRNIMPVPRLMNNLRSEEDEIVRECGNERGTVGVRSNGKPEQQKCGVNPRQPFNFYRQNKKDVDDFVGIKSRERKEEGGNQHAVGEIAAEEKRRDGRPNNSYD